MKKLFFIPLLFLFASAFSQTGTDSANYWYNRTSPSFKTPMAAKLYVMKYLAVDSGLTVNKKSFFYDSAFFKGRAYYNVLPSTSDSSAQLASTEWVKKYISSAGGVGGSGSTDTYLTYFPLTVSQLNDTTYKLAADTTKKDSSLVSYYQLKRYADSSIAAGGGGANIYNSNGSIPNSTDRTVTIGNSSKVIMTTGDIADVGLKVRATNSSYSDDDLFEVEVNTVRSFSVGTSVEINKPATFADDAYFSGKIKLGGSPGTSGQVLTSQGSGSAPIWAAPSGGSDNLNTVAGRDSSTHHNISVLGDAKYMGVFSETAFGNASLNQNETTGGSLWVSNPAGGTAIYQSTNVTGTKTLEAPNASGTVALRAADSTSSPINMIYQGNDGLFHKAAVPGGGKKEYVALLTQSGGDNPQTITSGLLTVGVTYNISNFSSGDDFTNVGAPSNTSGVSFVATGTTPTNWTHASHLDYNGGAPVVTVLENTIGNVWWTFASTGFYYAMSSSLFTADKTAVNIGPYNDDNSLAFFGISYLLPDQVGFISRDPGNSYANDMYSKTTITITIYP